VHELAKVLLNSKGHRFVGIVDNGRQEIAGIQKIDIPKLHQTKEKLKLSGN